MHTASSSHRAATGLLSLSFGLSRALVIDVNRAHLSWGVCSSAHERAIRRKATRAAHTAHADRAGGTIGE